MASNLERDKMAKKAKVEKMTDAPGYLPIDGMAPKRYPALDKLCEDFLHLQTAATAAKDKRDEKHDQLNAAMHERKLTQYKHDATGKVFERTTKEHIKHKNLKVRESSNGINPQSDDDEEAGDKKTYVDAVSGEEGDPTK